MLQNFYRRLLGFGGGHHEVLAGRLQIPQELVHARIGHVLQPALPDVVFPEFLRGSVHLSLVKAVELREGLVQGRADEVGQIVRRLLDAEMVQSNGHSLGNPHLGVRQGAVQIK